MTRHQDSLKSTDDNARVEQISLDKQKGDIAEDLHPLIISLAGVRFDPANARKHNERNIETIKSSLSQFGQRKPIVVQKDGMIVRAGNGTVEAAKALGWTHIAATICDDDNLTAAAYAIADNRSGDLAEWDYETLGDLIDGLGQENEELTKSLGFSETEITDLLAADWSPPDAEGDLGKDYENLTTVKFDGEQWGIVSQAIEIVRKQRGNKGLEPAACLEAVCSGLLDREQGG